MIIREKLIYALIIFGVFLALVMTIWYLFGHSPTIEQLLLAYVVPSYIFTFGIFEKLNNKIENLNNKLSLTREEFQKEIGEVKRILGNIEGKINR